MLPIVFFYYWSVIIYPLKNSSLRPLCKRHFGKLYWEIQKAIAVNGQIQCQRSSLQKATQQKFTFIICLKKKHLCIGTAYFTQQRRWRSQFDANANQTKYYTRLPFSNYSKWHTLVSFSHSGFARTNRNVWQFIMLKKKMTNISKGIDDLPTVPIVLSEWTDLKPENIHRMLHNANDYPALKKKCRSKLCRSH